jgi:aminoglycoside phosphotransferase (APT) family kinase protein
MMPDATRPNCNAPNPVPKHELYRIVEDVTGLQPIDLDPIESGFANEVYAVRTRPGDKLIVRVQVNPGIGCASEADAMRLCRLVGLPVPEVYGISHLAEDGHEIMVMAMAAGMPLGSIISRLNHYEISDICRQIGAALRMVHTIELSGFGPFGRNITSLFSTWEAYSSHEIEMRRRDMADILKAGVTDSEAGMLLSLVKELANIEQERAVFCHGDLSADHLFVDDQLRLSGIIDFGMSQGCSKVLDMAMLLMYHPELDLDAIVQGYEVTLPSALTLQKQIASLQANIAMSFLAHDIRRGDDASMQEALWGLRSLLQSRTG